MTSDSASKRLLAVDDDPVIGRLMQAVFRPEGLDVVVAYTAAEALERARVAPPDIAVLDVGLPDASGLELLAALLGAHPGLPVIMFSGSHEVKTAVRAMQLGAVDFLTKPIERHVLVTKVRQQLERRALRAEVQNLRRSASVRTLAEQMGPSGEVVRISEGVARVAGSGLTALLLGESGTGKELVAQAIHRESERRERPLIAVDCGAIPESLLESELFGYERGAFTGAEKRRQGQFHLADGGTLFLDEIGNLPLSLQPKLLRVLESRELVPLGGGKPTRLDVRFVAATNADLPLKVKSGAFREDLYYRIAQFTIRLPPLRERTGDIAHLAARFLEEACIELRQPHTGITDEALAALEAYRWPGNVRELRNVIRQAVLSSSDLAIDLTAIGPLLGGAPPVAEAPTAAAAAAARALPPGASLKQIAEAAAAAAERTALCAALRAAGGNKSAAAKALRTDYKTLHVKLRRHGIGPADYG